MRPELASDIDDAVKVRIEMLDLVGLGLNPVVQDQIGPDISKLNTEGQLPAVCITSDGETESIGPVSSFDEAGWYPVRVQVVDKIRADPHAMKRKYRVARGALMEAFKVPASGRFVLDGVPEVSRCNIQPDIVFDPRFPQNQCIQTGFVLRFWALAER